MMNLSSSFLFIGGKIEDTARGVSRCFGRRRLKFFDDFFKNFIDSRNFRIRKGKIIMENVLIRN
jgi:hypothetical protein